MRLFKSRRSKLTGRQQAIAQQVAGKILRWQRIAANYLNGKTSGLSSRTWLVLLVGFCVVFGAYCGYLLVQGF